jgi:hypothetical protein
LTLTRRLVKAGVLTPKGRKEKRQMKIKRGRQDSSDDEDYLVSVLSLNAE